MEDYGVIYLGSAIFKIARLLFIAMFSVHLFACVFFRVKVASASTPEDVTEFYTSKNVDSNVSKNLIHTRCSTFLHWISKFESYVAVSAVLQDLGQQYVSSCCFQMNYPMQFWTEFFSPPKLITLIAWHQLVCFYYVLTTFTTVGYGNPWWLCPWNFCAPSLIQSSISKSMIQQHEKQLLLHYISQPHPTPTPNHDHQGLLIGTTLVSLGFGAGDISASSGGERVSSCLVQ